MQAHADDSESDDDGGGEVGEVGEREGQVGAGDGHGGKAGGRDDGELESGRRTWEATPERPRSVLRRSQGAGDAAGLAGLAGVAGAVQVRGS